MPQPSQTAITKIREIAATQLQDATVFSDFEAKFILEQIARIEQYGDDTHFSEKQIVLIDKINAEKVRGEVAEVIEKLPNPVSITQLKDIEKELLVDVDSLFSDYETGFIANQLARIKERGDTTAFSTKQSALIERIHAEKVRGEKVEKTKFKA